MEVPLKPLCYRLKWLVVMPTQHQVNVLVAIVDFLTKLAESEQPIIAPALNCARADIERCEGLLVAHPPKRWVFTLTFYERADEVDVGLLKLPVGFAFEYDYFHRNRILVKHEDEFTRF